MAFDLYETFQLDIAQMNFKNLHSAISSSYKINIPFLIWLLENPNSLLALPIKISLRYYDYIYILLGRRIFRQNEAFEIASRMGNYLKTNKLHLLIYKFSKKNIY